MVIDKACRTTKWAESKPVTAKAVAPSISTFFAEIGWRQVIPWLTADCSLHAQVCYCFTGSCCPGGKMFNVIELKAFADPKGSKADYEKNKFLWRNS